MTQTTILLTRRCLFVATSELHFLFRIFHSHPCIVRKRGVCVCVCGVFICVWWRILPLCQYVSPWWIQCTFRLTATALITDMIFISLYAVLYCSTCRWVHPLLSALFIRLCVCIHAVCVCVCVCLHVCVFLHYYPPYAVGQTGIESWSSWAWWAYGLDPL